MESHYFMDTSRIAALACILSTAALSTLSARATSYMGDGYPVGVIRPGGDRQCTLFQLVGVSQSDPVLPSSPWFALEFTAYGYKEAVATLLAAKAAGRNVQVVTTGTVSAVCGHPAVSVIMWP